MIELHELTPRAECREHVRRFEDRQEKIHEKLDALLVRQSNFDATLGIFREEIKATREALPRQQ
jgi:N12 class adenine-specific DNA methylase